MDSLFDVLGPLYRAADVTEALGTLAQEAEAERGAVFTRPEVAGAILDLAGYTADRSLHQLRLLEPSAGEGDFLLVAVDRLLLAWQREGGQRESIVTALANSIRAVELHPPSAERLRDKLTVTLNNAGLGEHAKHIVSQWIICDDFLLTHIAGSFDVIVGNPPYVRQERIPTALLNEYKLRYRTIYDRADLYIPFYERALDLLAPGGRLGFICANRWMKNRYGAPLRGKINAGFSLLYFIDTEEMDAFQSDVLAYPAITIIERPKSAHSPRAVTRILKGTTLREAGLSAAVAAMMDGGDSLGTEEVQLDGGHDSPWLLDDLPKLHLLRRLEACFPAIEQAECKVGIGVATGCDRVYIDDFEDLPVEPERKLPLVMARDLVKGTIKWSGKGVINPFEDDGSLANLERYPRFASYLYRHYQQISGRHVAKRSGDGWFRTIDRIYPQLLHQPKILVPDIKGEAEFSLDAGRYYPHHNLYFITSTAWDLSALQTVLRSSLSLMIIGTYCTKMSGGFLRFQAQYLRRLRLPLWRSVPEHLRSRLIAAPADDPVYQRDDLVAELFGLSPQEASMVQDIAMDIRSRTGRAGLKR